MCRYNLGIMHAPDPSSCHEPRHEVMILVILVLVVLARARPTQCYSHHREADIPGYICNILRISRHTPRYPRISQDVIPILMWVRGTVLYMEYTGQTWQRIRLRTVQYIPESLSRLLPYSRYIGHLRSHDNNEQFIGDSMWPKGADLPAGMENYCTRTRTVLVDSDDTCCILLVQYEYSYGTAYDSTRTSYEYSYCTRTVAFRRFITKGRTIQ